MGALRGWTGVVWVWGSVHGFPWLLDWTGLDRVVRWIVNDMNKPKERSANLKHEGKNVAQGSIRAELGLRLDIARASSILV